jgi:hypothetical protein
VPALLLPSAPASSIQDQALLILVVDARRYFKQSEIVLYRQAPEQQPQLAIDQPGIGGKLPIHTPPTPA